MKKLLLLFLVTLFFSNTLILNAYADEETNIKTEYEKNLTLNQLIAGMGQFSLKQDKEAFNYMLTSIPLTLAGEALVLYYFYNKGGIKIEPYRENNKTYLTKYGYNNTDEKNLILYSGFFLLLYGTLISTYSTYAYHRDFSDKYFTNSVKKGKEELFDLVVSPFKSENILNFDFFPMFPLTVISGLQADDIAKIGGFWQKEKVPFMGVQVTPWQGVLLELASVSALVIANATWEEIQYRGLTLEKSNLSNSAFSFGLAHAGNALYPNTSIEDTALQTTFATLFGFYAGYKTEQNNYDFRRMIALHFWHNVTASLLGYMTNPDKGLFFINYSYKF